MGFLTVGRRFLLDQNEIIDDRIDVVCRGFLGLTVTCARCHDHKFDPIPTEDYYSLYGVFASYCRAGRAALARRSGGRTARYAEYQKKLEAARTERDEYPGSPAGRVRGEMPARLSQYLKAGQTSVSTAATGSLTNRRLPPNLNRAGCAA